MMIVEEKIVFGDVMVVLMIVDVVIIDCVYFVVIEVGLELEIGVSVVVY